MKKLLTPHPATPEHAKDFPVPNCAFSRSLLEAYEILCQHLWPALRAQAWWWNDDSASSVLAAHTAADFLDRLGVSAVVVSGTLSVFPYEERTGELIGHGAVAVGKVTPWSPTTHAFVLINDAERLALLETALFQMQESHLCRLPDMAMVPVLPQDAINLLSSDDSVLAPPVAHAATWRVPGGSPGGQILDVVWGILREPADWSTYADADPARVQAAADRIARARRSGSRH